ncbi:MAG: hypothetical protein IJ455_02580 [Agathobacter sp.]|nr:hypothetical protein [Agathobacter sp.]
MQMENSKETFEYTYSAEQQAEIEKIKSKYIPKTDDKLEQLRKLDASVTKKGTVIGLIMGIAGTLIFGGGMSMVLVVGMKLLIPSIVLGGIGIILMVFAYPAFKKITEQERERIAPQILALTEELGQ